MKKFVTLAWRRSVDERIPLSSNNRGEDNGSISKNKTPKEPTEKTEKEKMAEDKVADPEVPIPEYEPMSLLRKFAIFLSLDVIALYVVVFAWIIPCRHLECRSEHQWTANLNNISISTNLEITGLPGAELLLLGYYLRESEDSKGVIAVKSSAGSVKWEVSVDFNPIHCHCNIVDVNRDGVKDCLILGEDHLLALNASNGHVFWIQNFSTIAPLVITIGDCEDEDSAWIVLVEGKGSHGGHVSDEHQNGNISMIILDSKNGTVYRKFPLPCDYFPKELVTWKSKANATQIAFQCSRNGRAEVRLISEEDLCNLVFNRRLPKMRGFSLVFRLGSSAAVKDVLLLPVSHVGLIVCWSTMVAMVTDARNPPRLLWQAPSGSIRSAIKFVLGGHFTSSKLTQIAVIVHDGLSNSVRVVNVLDGKKMAEVELGSGEVSSIMPIFRKKITGKDSVPENVDSLLIAEERTVWSTPNVTSSDVVDFVNGSAFAEKTPHESGQVKSYLLLTFGKKNNVTELLTENRRTEIAVESGDCTTVFLATLLPNQTTRISSFDLKDQYNSGTSCSCR